MSSSSTSLSSSSSSDISSSSSIDYALGSHEIFNTDASPVRKILNIDKGANLAAIGNKLYLIYQGIVQESSSSEDEDSLSTEDDLSSQELAVTVTFPAGGEQLVIGETYLIRWSSTKGYGDIVQIALYHESLDTLIITPRTSNDGLYEWEIPTSVLPITGYSIGITWLQAGSDGETDYSNEFSVVYPQNTTTTTTTLEGIPVEEELPPIWRGIPLLVLSDDEYITELIEDKYRGGIIIATSQGRIIQTDMSVINGYFGGDRKVYAEVKDGFGIQSKSAWTEFLYEVYNKIIELNTSNEVVRWKFQEQPTAIPVDTIDGEFLSPILTVNEDLGTWKDLLWREEKPIGTDIIICVRVAESSEEILTKEWDYCFTSRDSDRAYGATGVISRSLEDIGRDGNYIQFKISMSTTVKSTTPSVLQLSISYMTKFAVYFFTTRFTMDINATQGLITADITEPENTEIQFGITDKDSADWDDYQLTPLNKFFDLDSIDNIKVGIKLIALDENVPEVANFAVMLGGDDHKKLGT